MSSEPYPRHEKIRNWLDKICNELDLPEEIRFHADDLLEQAPPIVFGGRKSRSLAAGAVYLASILEDDKIPQDKIADVTGSRRNTVTKLYKLFVIEIGLLEETPDSTEGGDRGE